MSDLLDVPLLRGPAFAVTVFWAATAFGSYVFRWIGLRDGAMSRVEKGLVCAALGFGALQYLPWSLSLFGWMTPPVVRTLSGALVLILAPRMARVARAAWIVAGDELRRRWQPADVAWVAAFALLMGMVLLRACFVGPEGDDDGYHLTAPQRWLHDGTLSYLPTFTNTNAAAGFEMMYALGLADCGPGGAKLLHYGAGLAAMLAIVLFARRLGSRYSGPLAVSLLAIGNPVINLLYLYRVAYVDLGACWMGMMTALMWLVWRRERTSASLVGMALMAGYAGSFKITALVLAVSWIPALIFDAPPGRPNSFKSIAGRVLLFGSVALVPVLPWPLRNWLLTGNPLYPMLSGLIPTRDWTAEQAKIFGSYMRLHSWGVASGAALSESTRGLILIATACALGACGSIAFLRLREPEFRWPVFSATLFIVASVMSTGLVFRYWIPGLAMLFAVGCAALMRSDFLRSAAPWPAIAATVVALVVCGRAMAQAVPVEPRPFAAFARIATGLSTPEIEYADDPIAQMTAVVRSQTRRDAKILDAAFYETNGASSFGAFSFDRQTFVTDSHLQTAIRLDSWVSFSEDVRRLGITHVLVADEQFCKGRLGMTFTASENEFPFARQLVEKYGEKVAQFGHFQLYRLWTQSLDDAIANGQDAQRPGFALDRAGAAEAH